MKYISLIQLIIVFLMSSNAQANHIPAFYHMYSKKHNVPVEVFFSVIKTESGRSFNGRFLPWPWTLNVNHKPYYYKSQKEAVAALRQFLTNPKNTIAVGLGQIYLPAHGDKFTNPLVLLDPHINLNFAAQLLRYEYTRSIKINKTSNWWIAAGRYHHPSKEKFAKPYREIVYRKCQQITNQCHLFGQI